MKQLQQQQKGESQRIYWQQWLSTGGNSTSSSRRELITSSAAIRISPDGATARDVTQLLRKTLNLSSLPTVTTTATATTTTTMREEKKNEIDDHNNNNSSSSSSKNNSSDDDDSLVLVGTLYSLPNDYVSFEHNYYALSSSSSSNDGNDSSSSKHPSQQSHYSDPFHVVKTLAPNDNPIKIRDKLMDQLRKLQQDAPAGRSVISPKFQWYFVPSPRPQPPPHSPPSNNNNNNNNNHNHKQQQQYHPQSPIPSCIDLDGYCTSMEEEDYASDGDNDDDEGSDDSDDIDVTVNNDDDNDGTLPRQPLQASQSNNNNNNNNNDNNNDKDDNDNKEQERIESQKRNNDEETLFQSSINDNPDLLLFRALMKSSNAITNTTSFKQQQRTKADNNSNSSSNQDCINQQRKQRQSKYYIKEWKRSIQLQQAQATATSPIAGYLLKQSHVDKHVWRRVYCVLTDDHLWYATRVPYYHSQHNHHHHHRNNNSSSSPPTTTTTNNNNNNKKKNDGYGDFDNSYPPLKLSGKHGKISLGRALLLEPNVEYTNSSLYKIPNAFEVVSSRGLSHRFRAPNRTVQKNWIHALSSKIIESYENSLMDHAELIVSDEAIARNKRIQSTAIDPLLSRMDNMVMMSTTSTSSTNEENKNKQEESTRDNYSSNGSNNSSVRNAIASVVRLGLDISEYREQCRHIQAFLTIDKDTNKRRVQKTWDMATELLSKATTVTIEVQKQHTNTTTTTKSAKQISRSLEVLCRHVDYVITGQQRQFQLLLSGEGTNEKMNGDSSSSSSKKKQQQQQRAPDPPPMDLFDLLLTELQTFVGSHHFLS